MKLYPICFDDEPSGLPGTKRSMSCSRERMIYPKIFEQAISQNCQTKRSTLLQKEPAIILLDHWNMDDLLFFRGLLIGFSIAAPVGPIGVLCIRRTLSDGRLSGLVSGLGAATADAL